MKILVTGGAGFIGSHVVDALIEQNHEVLIIDDLSTGKQEYINQQAQFIELDVLDERMETIVVDFDPDTIIHLAAQKNVRVSLEDPVYDARVNILGSLTLLEAARRHNINHVVCMSTGGMYDETGELPFTEDSPIRPSSPYLLSKYAIDQYADYYTRIHGLKTTCIRLTNTYGPRQDPKGEAGVISIFFEKFAAKTPATIFGDGKQTRDFLYIADAVAAVMKVVEKQPAGVINIATNNGVTIEELYALQAGIADMQEPPEKAPAIPGEVKHHIMTSIRAEKDLDWHAQVTLEEGLQKTWEWFTTIHNT